VDFIVVNSRLSENSFALHANHQRQARRRVAQYALCQTVDNSSMLAWRLIRHKLAISIRVLRRQPQSAAQQKALNAARQQTAVLLAPLDIEQLRGHEGSAQRELFRYWQQCLPARLGFTSRQRRPPPDPVNALLSLTFTLAYHEAIRQCLVHGLDPWLGIYHQLAAGRMSLACDLMEPLRPSIEAWVVERFLQGDFDNRHFGHNNGACQLGKAGRELYYQLWHAQLPYWSKRLGRYAALLARHLEQSAPHA
jgi:CRISPR-associated protein Cas1